MKYPRLPMYIATLVVCTACGGGGGSSSPVPSVGGGGSGGSGTPPAGGGSSPSNPPSSGNAIGVELEGGVSGTGLNLGPVQGFSSVIVNGLAMDVSNADIFIEGSAGSQSDLKVGQTVSIIGDLQSRTAQDLRYRSNVKGPLTSINLIDPLTGEATLTVLGQSVRTDAATLYENTAIDLLTAGDLLEVSGQRNANNELVASYIERESAMVEYKVTGTPSNITATAFQIDALQVSYDSATLQNFGSGGIESDQLVEVRAAAANFTAPADLTADTVERIPEPTINEESELELEGYINAFASSSDFEVAGQRAAVDANTAFELGSEEDLGVNVKIEIEGDVENGILIAERISFRPSEAVRIEGPATSIDIGANSITALGLTFAVRALTELEDDSSAGLDPLTLDQLSAGDYLEIRGFVEGSTLVAVEVERDDPDNQARLRAPVLTINSGAGALDLFGVTVSGNATTSYEDNNGNTISQSQFFATLVTGTFVEAQWDLFTSTGAVADSLSIEDDD